MTFQIKFRVVVALFLLQITQIKLSNADGVLESVAITNWGDWGQFQNCTHGTQVQTFQLMTEGPNDDNTALNGIRFYCGVRGGSGYTNVLTSTVAGWGSWGKNFSCGFGRGHMNGFQLNAQPYQESNDDSATNNLRIFCSDDKDPINDFLEGDGLDLGEWNQQEHIQRCQPGEAICGLQTQVEKYQEDDDDTALNNIRVKCCTVV